MVASRTSSNSGWSSVSRNNRVEEPFIGLNRMYPNYGDWLVKSCRRVSFTPLIVKKADGAASALAFVAAGFGVAVISEPLQKIHHLFLLSACQRFGIWYSRAGNGVSHPVHQERFGKPGKTMLGSDSHTPAAGAIGLLAIGAGGLGVAMPSRESRSVSSRNICECELIVQK